MWQSEWGKLKWAKDLQTHFQRGNKPFNGAAYYFNCWYCQLGTVVRLLAAKATGWGCKRRGSGDRPKDTRNWSIGVCALLFAQIGWLGDDGKNSMNFQCDTILLFWCVGGGGFQLNCMNRLYISIQVADAVIHRQLTNLFVSRSMLSIKGNQ